MSGRSKAYAATVACLGFWLTAVPAWGCSVCFGGGGNSAYAARLAYYLTTMVMIVLPLGLAGGFVYWVRYHLSGTESPRGDPTSS